MRLAQARSGLMGAAILLAACASTVDAQPPGGDPIGDLIGEQDAGESEESVTITFSDSDPVKPPGSLAAYLSHLERSSCFAGIAKKEPDALAIKASPVPLQGLNPGRKTIGQLTYAGGFHLTSDDKRFGGLSGIDVLDDGNLLAVSDTGLFVWIDLAADGVTPSTARVAPMLDAKGEPFANKGAGDAEGLAVIGEFALVSFEGEHRVLVYDIGKCGAAARGTPVEWSMDDAFTQKNIAVDGNRGVEALAITPDWYVFAGIETRVGMASPLSARPVEAAPEFDLAIGQGAPELVGLDLLPAGEEGRDVRAFSLHRSTKALSSNVIVVNETYLHRSLDQSGLPARVVSEIDERSHYRFEVASTRSLAELNVLVTIDNFEGIAAKQLPDGRVRLFIVSDDNFSASQRTLLMVFDVAEEK
jgi:hypothetical protein